MSALIIPTSPRVYSYSEEVTMDGTPRILDFHWNYRGQYWVMDVLDIERNVLVAGVKIVIGYSLLSQHVDRNLPKGLVIAYDASGKNLTISEDALGNEIQLMFVPQEDVNGLV